MDNLCNYFILPLLGLNKLSYGEGNFINSYLSKENDLVVELDKDTDTSVLEEHIHYATDLYWEDKLVVIYAIPDEFKSDCELFREGKYSRFSAKSKDLIKKNSGLTYMKQIDPKDPKKVISNPRLLALDRNKELRHRMEEELGVKISPEDELLSIPDENNFHKF